MTKAYSCVGEQQFHAYHIIEDLKKTKDYVNQFGELIHGWQLDLSSSHTKCC